MEKPHIYFGLFLLALRREGHAIDQPDNAEVAQLIADALDIIQPDDDTNAITAPSLSISFAMIAQDIRDVQEAHDHVDEFDPPLFTEQAAQKFLGTLDEGENSNG